MSYEETLDPAIEQRVITRADGSPIRAVVVDDEESLVEVISTALEYEGWEVRTAQDGQEALSLIRDFKPDIVVLDIMMPRIDGLRVVKRLHADGLFMPILLLTAKDAISDRVAGLGIGGDDYLTKPFSLEELIARLQALLRRSNLNLALSESTELRVGDLVLNEETFQCSRAGTPISLTATEFKLLSFLMHNPSHLMSKTQLLSRVWNNELDERSNVVELYISYLRKKIHQLGPPMIHTVHGMGYALRPAQ